MAGANVDLRHCYTTSVSPPSGGQLGVLLCGELCVPCQPYMINSLHIDTHMDA